MSLGDGVYRSRCLLVRRFINRECFRKRFCSTYLSPDATSVRRLCVVLSGSLWLRRGEELRSGERGCPAPPKLDEEKLRTFCYLYLSVFSVLLLHYAYISFLRAFAYPTCDECLPSVFWRSSICWLHG